MRQTLFFIISIASVITLASAQDCLLKKIKCKGELVGKYKAKTFDQCSYYCLENDECEYWTFTKGKKGGTCYLFKSCEEVSDKASISGPVGCPPPRTTTPAPTTGSSNFTIGPIGPNVTTGPGPIGPIGPILPPPYCPRFLIRDGVFYEFYGEGWTDCYGSPLSKCVYKHGPYCYCEKGDGNIQTTPCYIEYDFPSSDKSAKSLTPPTIIDVTVGRNGDVSFDDFPNNFEISQIVLYPAALGTNLLVCGGLTVTYNSNDGTATKTHGDVSQSVPFHDPITIDLSIDTYITGATFRVGDLLDQINFATTTGDGPAIGHPCGGFFGQPANGSPPPTNGNCFLYSLGGKTSSGFLSELTLHWNCQQPTS